jgi:hypothetical protein
MYHEFATFMCFPYCLPLVAHRPCLRSTGFHPSCTAFSGFILQGTDHHQPRLQRLTSTPEKAKDSDSILSVDLKNRVDTLLDRSWLPNHVKRPPYGGLPKVIVLPRPKETHIRLQSTKGFHPLVIQPSRVPQHVCWYGSTNTCCRTRLDMCA